MTTIKSISIAEPCHQSWQQMTINQKGMHCAHCCKTVVDFTVMSDKEIVQYLSEKTNICGRIERYQMAHINNTLSYQKPKAGWWKKAFIIFSLLCAGSFKANAQSKPLVKMAHHKKKRHVHNDKPQIEGVRQKRNDSLEVRSLSVEPSKLLIDANQIKSYSLEKEIHCTAILGGISVVSTTYNNITPQTVWIRVRKAFATRSELLFINFVNSRPEF